LLVEEHEVLELVLLLVIVLVCGLEQVWTMEKEYLFGSIE